MQAAPLPATPFAGEIFFLPTGNSYTGVRRLCTGRVRKILKSKEAHWSISCTPRRDQHFRRFRQVLSVLFEYEPVIKTSDGVKYRARACGSELDDGRWQGWIEFLPPRGGRVLLSPRETIRSTKADLQLWASGLTTVELQDALGRALDRTPAAARVPPKTRRSREERQRNSRAS